MSNYFNEYRSNDFNEYQSNDYNQYQSNDQHEYHPKYNSVVSGNSIDIKMHECKAAEVRADVVVETSGGKGKDCSIVRLWGQIKDCHGKPVANALLKLVKVVCCASGTQYQGVAHTVSDCEGFYQFDLCYCDGSECYKVLVSKAYTEAEQVILTGAGNCKACKHDNEPGGGMSYQPCKPHETIVTHPGHGSKCGCEEPRPCPPRPCPPQPCPPQPCPPQPCPPKPCPPKPCPPKPCPPPMYPPCGCNKNGYEYTGTINIPSPYGH